jgi:uncharacterized protein (DUF433 family)/DNA-binding transcriptional MerR regulator
MKPGHLAAAYTADRAAGLAGIPPSTLHYWSRTGIWFPSVSPTKVKLWSYADLLGLRLVDWLRKDKPDLKLPHTSMRKIRQALTSVEAFGERLRQQSLRVWVDRRGGIVLGIDEGVFVPVGRGLLQSLMGEEVDLLDAFVSSAGVRAPNLVTPRPTIRIIPGKLSGEPHVVDTRIPTNVVAAMTSRGFDSLEIVRLYPSLTEENVREAIDLEDQLQAALHPVAA